MGMVDLDMANAAKKKQSCEERLKKLNNTWKQKVSEIMRDSDMKVEDMRKKMIKLCNQHAKKRNDLIKQRFLKMRNDVMTDANKRHRSAMRPVVQENQNLKAEVARLKAENAQLADAVARTAAAMTLSGMPRKRRRPGFQDLGNPPMW